MGRGGTQWPRRRLEAELAERPEGSRRSEAQRAGESRVNRRSGGAFSELARSSERKPPWPRPASVRVANPKPLLLFPGSQWPRGTAFVPPPHVHSDAASFSPGGTPLSSGGLPNKNRKGKLGLCSGPRYFSGCNFIHRLLRQGRDPTRLGGGHVQISRNGCPASPVIPPPRH